MEEQKKGNTLESATSKPDALLWSQFCKLGEMMGDGLHNEPDGKWISKEYKRLYKILMPEQTAINRKLKAEAIDAQMAKLLEGRKCDCGGEIKQGRSGSKVAYCKNCNNRFVARAK